jgi:hypothetical protein
MTILRINHALFTKNQLSCISLKFKGRLANRKIIAQINFIYKLRRREQERKIFFFCMLREINIIYSLLGDAYLPKKHF